MSKEDIYDQQIAPLMASILAICKDNNIAMIADFHVPSDDDEHLHCTSMITGGGAPSPPRIMRAALHLEPGGCGGAACGVGMTVMTAIGTGRKP